MAPFTPSAAEHHRQQADDDRGSRHRDRSQAQQGTVAHVIAAACDAQGLILRSAALQIRSDRLIEIDHQHHANLHGVNYFRPLLGNDASALGLIVALLAEHYEVWQARRHLDMDRFNAGVRGDFRIDLRQYRSGAHPKQAMKSLHCL